jgi:hypothetical protein
MRALAFALVLAGLAGPALADASAAASPATDVPPPLPQSVWRTSDGDDLVHLQSGLSCPHEYAGLHRTEAKLFDGLGFDVGCNYAAPGVALTVYIFRRPANTVAAAMAQAKDEYLTLGADRHPTPISEGSVGDGGLTWSTALYAEDGNLRSGIRVAELQDWIVLYRVTYRTSAEAAAGAGMSEMSTLVRTSAGAQLDRCAKSPTPKRDGARITSAKAVQDAAMMTSILGGAMLSAAADKKAKDDSSPVQEITWCAEAPMQVAPYRMIFWRAVDADGEDADLDRITVASIGPAPTLALAADGLAGLIGGNGGPVHWAATMSGGNGATIYAYFKSRPSSASVAALFSDILSGKAKPVGSYAVDGKSISIGVPGE